MTRFDATPLASGIAAGRLELLSSPLSLWGGVDLATGEIVDASHPQRGLSLAGRIVAMQAARGSSSSSSALAESVRVGVNPAGIILARPDPILLIGSLVAAELYGVCVPIAVVAAEFWPWLENTRWARITATQEQANVCCDES